MDKDISRHEGLKRGLRESGVVLFGAGTTGGLIADLMRNCGIPVRIFIDNHASIQERHDAPVFHPARTPLSVPERKQAIVVVSIGGIPGFDVDTEKRKLRDLDYNHIFTLPEFYAAFGSELEASSRERGTYVANAARIAAVRERLTDGKSRDILERVVAYRSSLNPAAHPPIDGECYFPNDIPPWPSPLRLADCGAYDGDTIRYILQRGIATEAIAAFEPDPNNFSKLAAFVEQMESAASIVCLPCGVGDKGELLHFDSGMNSGSKIVREGEGKGNSAIIVARLDEALAGFKPNLIKMDIEGGESAALRGAECLFAKQSPGLAVSIYHNPADLWELPELIFKLTVGKRYTYHIRDHCIYTTDLVFYAVPRRNS